MSLNRISPAATRAISPQEEALQSLCKQLVKSRLFRGYYRERLYVDAVGGYRDMVALQRDEKAFEKTILDLLHKLHLFYKHHPVRMWIGISHGSPTTTAATSWEPDALQTCVWAELTDLAFGQYWFSVKSLRFREREIVLKLKMVRAMGSDISEGWSRRRQSSTSSIGTSRSSAERARSLSHAQTAEPSADCATSNVKTTEPDTAQIGLEDFVQLMGQWGHTIKQTAYDFMSNDISKDNIKGLLRFLCLVVVSILSGTAYGIRFLGDFVLRFMFEISRVAHVLTPILLKIIDVLNKMIGGFYILIAMIWRDLVHGRQPKQKTEAVEFQRPQYKSIDYRSARSAATSYQFNYQGSQLSEQPTPSQIEFERKFQ